MQDYSVEHLSPTQTAMLEDLRDYGIIWQRKVKDNPILYRIEPYNHNSPLPSASAQLVWQRR